MPCEQTAALRDRLTGALIGLARATEGNEYLLTASTAAVTVEGLRATRPNADYDGDALLALLDKVDAEKRRLVPACYQCAASCGRTNDYDMGNLRHAEEDIRTLKLLILSRIRDIAARSCQDASIHNFLYRALFAIGRDDWDRELLQPIAREAEELAAA